MVLYKCENNHNGEISLNEYLRKYKENSITKEKCEYRNSQQECSKCNKFVCLQCLMNKHKLSKGHKFENLNKYDSLCKIHFNSFSSYCKNCKKNICELFNNEHKEHKLIGLSSIIVEEDLKNNFKK